MNQQVKKSLCGCDVMAPDRELLSYEQALERIELVAEEFHSVERVPLAAAYGRRLSAPLFSPMSLPHFDNAAMDGFAVRISDIGTGGAATLPIGQRVVAGDTAQQKLGARSCARIFTGAPLPLGTDTVIAQEEVLYDATQATFSSPRKRGQNIRRQGENLRDKARLAEKGQRVDAATLMLAASVGLSELPVKRQLSVAIVRTGDELIELGQPLRHGQLYDANGPLLRALIEASGATVGDVLHCVDSHAATASLFASLAENHDLIVTTGGVSVGEEDHILEAFHNAGGKLDFAGVAIKPGKPVAFGKIGAAYFLGLPGNPVACLVTWALFGQSLLGALTGTSHSGKTRRVVCDKPISHKGGRREFRLATLGHQKQSGFQTVTVSARPSSADISQLIKADGLISLPADLENAEAGTPLEFFELNL